MPSKVAMYFFNITVSCGLQRLHKETIFLQKMASLYPAGVFLASKDIYEVQWSCTCFVQHDDWALEQFDLGSCRAIVFHVHSGLLCRRDDLLLCVTGSSIPKSLWRLLRDALLQSAGKFVTEKLFNVCFPGVCFLLLCRHGAVPRAVCGGKH